MKSYLLVSFNTDGARPSDVVNRLAMLHFKPAHGNYDFVYEWDHDPSTEDAIELADKLHHILKGYGVLYKMETI